MADVVIENPVINSPYEEPRRHFVFDDDGITDQIADDRRTSSYFIPIPPPKKEGPQTALPGSWTAERVVRNVALGNGTDLVNGGGKSNCFRRNEHHSQDGWIGCRP